MRRVTMVVALVLAGCGGTNGSPAATATPYDYPDFPGILEVEIAEGDCEQLDVLLEWIVEINTASETRLAVIRAIMYRTQELACPVSA